MKKIYTRRHSIEDADDGIVLANNIIFEVWKQMGARRDFIDKIIGGVTEPLRQAMNEYLNKQL